MNFHIYRNTSNGFQLLGNTKYEEDARAMLTRWNSGYIVNSTGVMVFQKNM